MELKDTIKMMTSSDYKERFRAEYWQTQIRHQNLKKMLAKAQKGKLEFTPQCDLNIFQCQERYMSLYLLMMEVRANAEGIELESS